ncbi:1-acyl-sn-glycerol-3-phosphate acyltransferase beta-like [Culicoides brevitarsis]|uniref:1-acyl-sn-glycerol-3-phosphate acyltransferase beta-like n=1 Tax=Culicoides brevitarsis TaxID=469753 RepID=UPI00307CC47F
MGLTELFSSILWYYLLAFVICFVLYIPIVVAYFKSRLGTRANYHLWKSVILYPVMILPGLFIPLFVMRPRNTMNVRFCSWFVRKVSYLTGLSFEVRGANIAAMDQGAVICCNHQSAVDIYAQICLWKHFKLMTSIAKKEIFYLFPFGPAAWLSGLRYIDRSSSKKSYQTLSSVEKLMTEQRMKVWIYPEGTRNNKGGFLPFKKGAFYTAINAQVPIIPAVFAPYYFMDEPQQKFTHEKKHIILSVLEPIPTKGLTTADVDSLKEKVYSIMFAEYEKLRDEIMEKSKDPKWLNMQRPRVTLVDRKLKSP